ncbi:MAG: hypothetical protein RL472_605 [Pseudomonadota bacterium]
MKAAAMHPINEAEVREAILAARAPVTVIGGGTRQLGATAGAVLEMSGLSAVQLYEPGALTLVVQAGTPLVDVEALLAAERQRLAFEVPDLRRLLAREGHSTIGGVVASNASGPRRVQAGACRDSLLGVRFVDGAGRVVKNGGRVMKNVTGYDLVKLMAGSRGALGVLTEVSLRVQAQPETEVTLQASCGLEDGLATLRAALRSPFEVSGAAYAEGRALLRVEGMAGSVAYRARALRDRLGGDWDTMPDTASAALWRDVRDVSALVGQGGSVWRLVVKPSEAARLVRDLGTAAVVDWGGGLIWLLTEGGQGATVRAALQGVGHATLVRPSPGDEGTDVLPPESDDVARLSAGLRRSFDPRGIFAVQGQV